MQIYEGIHSFMRANVLVPTPDNDDEATSKKYVDDKFAALLSSISGYDANAVQELRNLHGTFTWVISALSSIAVTTPPTKVTYTAGEIFDPTGMIITATYANGQTLPVTGYTYTPTTALAITDTTVTITYVEGNVTKTATQAITVTAAEI